MGNRLKNLA